MHECGLSIMSLETIGSCVYSIIFSYFPLAESAKSLLEEKVKENDVLIIMGAGDIDSMARELIV